MEKLIEQLIADGYLKTPDIIAAFRVTHRRDFLTEESGLDESANIPLPIGFGQTISQPLTVAYMLELLEPQTGQKILDVGSGSGWTTALLAHIVGEKGHVYAIEFIPELKEFGQRNVAKYKFFNTTFYCQDGNQGLPAEAPFDRILVSAAAKKVPKALKQQLKIGGKMVIPTAQNDLLVIERMAKNVYKKSAYHGFVFVPLVAS